MTYQIKSPGASTHRASQISRVTRNRSVNTTIWQPKNRDQLDAAKSAKLYAARMGQKRRTRA